MARVYLETSFFSECCTIRTGVIARARKAASLDWWEVHAPLFDLFASAEVIRELSSPEFPAAVREPALAMAASVKVLPIPEAAVAVAEVLVKSKTMPKPATAGDALHLATAVVNQMDFLMTWNQKHLANPNKRVQLRAVCA